MNSQTEINFFEEPAKYYHENFKFIYIDLLTSNNLNLITEQSNIVFNVDNNIDIDKGSHVLNCAPRNRLSPLNIRIVVDKTHKQKCNI